MRLCIPTQGGVQQTVRSSRSDASEQRGSVGADPRLQKLRVCIFLWDTGVTALPARNDLRAGVSRAADPVVATLCALSFFARTAAVHSHYLTVARKIFGGYFGEARPESHGWYATHWPCLARAAQRAFLAPERGSLVGNEAFRARQIFIHIHSGQICRLQGNFLAGG